MRYVLIVWMYVLITLPWHDELYHMVDHDSRHVKPLRHLMNVPRQGIGNGLSFIVVIQAGQVSPTGISANFDQSCPKHDT